MPLTRTLIALAALVWTGMAPAAGVPMGTSVVVDAAERTAWIAAPEGRVAAVDLTDGRTRWNGPALGHPLARLDSGLLVALPPERAGTWRLAWVDPASGMPGDTFEAELPADVLASLEALPNQTFEVFVRPAERGVELHWFSQRWAFRGAKLEDDEGVTVREGVIGIDATRSRATRLDTAAIRPRIDLDADERIAGLAASDLQLRSADDRHLMVRNPIADARLGQRWEWQLHSRQGGEAVASVTLTEPAAPWLIDGDRLLWVARPALAVDDRGNLQEQPARLVAVGLENSNERWSVMLRDPVFRGSTPP